MTTCPSCGIAGNNFSCPNHISYWGINPLPDSIPTPQQGGIQLTHPISTELFAEIGRLNVLLNERDKEIEWLRGERPDVVAWLREPGDHPDPTRIITMRADEWAKRVDADADFIESGGHRKERTDQFGRNLPLEGHHKDCGNGKDGWSLCTCEGIGKIAALKQTSADLCPECGWRFLVPGIGCQGCERARLEVENEELKECLRWYVENDDTNEGGKWEEDNGFWLRGKRRAMRALGMEEE